MLVVLCLLCVYLLCWFVLGIVYCTCSCVRFNCLCCFLVISLMFGFVCFCYVDCCVVCPCVVVGVVGFFLMLFDCTFCLNNGFVCLSVFVLLLLMLSCLLFVC